MTQSPDVRLVTETAVSALVAASSPGSEVAYSENGINSSLYLTGSAQPNECNIVLVPAGDSEVWLEWGAHLRVVVGGQGRIIFQLYEATNGVATLRGGSTPPQFLTAQPVTTGAGSHYGKVRLDAADHDRLFYLTAYHVQEGSSFAGALHNLPLSETWLRAVGEGPSYSLKGSFYNAVSDEQEITFYPGPQKREGNYGVIYLHGSGATFASYAQATRWASSQLAAKITLAGIPGVSIQASGQAFANDEAMGDILEAIDWLESEHGCDPDKVHLIGASMGGGTAFRFASLHPDRVASVTGLMPLSSIINTYVNNVLGLRAQIGTAWGVTYPTPLPAGADLVALASDIDEADVPVQIWYDEADTAIPEADVHALSAAMGSSCTEIQIDPEDPGHTEGAVKWVIDHGDGGAQSVIDFLIENGA